MRELRLVPAAVVAWLATLGTVLVGPWLGLVGILVGPLVGPRHRGQAILCATSAGLFTVLAWVRHRRAEAFAFPREVTGRVVAEPADTPSGYLLRLRVEGYPAQLPVFVDESVAQGSTVTVAGSPTPSERPGIGVHVLDGDILSVAPPTGLSAWAERVATNFREACAVLGPASEGLVPGMVLGDTSGQSAADKQLYIDTGLSHLSAVSGSNVAIVCTAAAFLVTGPRARVAASLCALAVFVALVGFEPSVQRATVAGVAGLLAVLNSARMEPLHALSLGVLGLLIIDSDLAFNFGFALSVAATAGIVALSPLCVRLVARTGWPDLAVRAVAVALAADLVTMPLVALMSGQVSAVSTLANVLVAPAVAPITVLGLIAAVLSQLGPLAVLGAGLVKVIEPCSWWIHTIALGAQRLPHSTVEASPISVLLLGGWALAGLLYLRPVGGAR